VTFFVSTCFKYLFLPSSRPPYLLFFSLIFSLSLSLSLSKYSFNWLMAPAWPIKMRSGFEPRSMVCQAGVLPTAPLDHNFFYKSTILVQSKTLCFLTFSHLCVCCSGKEQYHMASRANRYRAAKSEKNHCVISVAPEIGLSTDDVSDKFLNLRAHQNRVFMRMCVSESPSTSKSCVFCVCV